MGRTHQFDSGVADGRNRSQTRRSGRRAPTSQQGGFGSFPFPLAEKVIAATTATTVVTLHDSDPRRDDDDAVALMLIEAFCCVAAVPQRWCGLPRVGRC